jgi:hypothetical protein
LAIMAVQTVFLENGDGLRMTAYDVADGHFPGYHGFSPAFRI